RLLEDYGRLPRSNDPTYREWEKWLKGPVPTLPVTFDQGAAAESPRAVYLSVVHPLVRQAARFLETTDPAFVALTAPSDAAPDGRHFFAVYRWAKQGVKPDESLVAVADDPRLEEELFSLLRSASDDSAAPLPSDVECDALDGRHHRKWAEERAR